MPARNWTSLKDLLGAAGTVVAVVALAIGVIQFRDTQERQEQASAVDLFVKYNEMMRESMKDLTPDQVKWKNNLGVAIAEAIFLLREEDTGWIRTVRSMLSDHKAVLEDREWLDCKSYAVAFQALINETLGRPECPLTQD